MMTFGNILSIIWGITGLVAFSKFGFDVVPLLCFILAMLCYIAAKIK